VLVYSVVVTNQSMAFVSPGDVLEVPIFTPSWCGFALWQLPMALTT
jgi:hypothetical protein